MNVMDQTGRSPEVTPFLGWAPRRAYVPVAAKEVQVWRIQAVSDGPLYEACFALLNLAELERFKRLRACVARDEFVIARGCLRTLLAGALATDPRTIPISTGKYGKPFIAGVEFSVTHSKGLILIALSLDTVIGVDVEGIDSTIEALAIANDTFAPNEIAQIAAAPEGEARVLAFYRCWVRKEAVVKAHGQGITLSLSDFDVAPVLQHEVCVMVPGTTADDQYFHVQGLPVGDRHAGAVALSRPGCTLRLFEFVPTAPAFR